MRNLFQEARLTRLEMNRLIADYLAESGYSASLNAFASEAAISNEIAPNGVLRRLYAKGLLREFLLSGGARAAVDFAPMEPQMSPPRTRQFSTLELAISGGLIDEFEICELGASFFVFLLRDTELQLYEYNNAEIVDFVRLQAEVFTVAEDALHVIVRGKWRIYALPGADLLQERPFRCGSSSQIVKPQEASKASEEISLEVSEVSEMPLMALPLPETMQIPNIMPQTGEICHPAVAEIPERPRFFRVNNNQAYMNEIDKQPAQDVHFCGDLTIWYYKTEFWLKEGLFNTNFDLNSLVPCTEVLKAFVEGEKFFIITDTGIVRGRLVPHSVDTVCCVPLAVPADRFLIIERFIPLDMENCRKCAHCEGRICLVMDNRFQVLSLETGAPQYSEYAHGIEHVSEGDGVMAIANKDEIFYFGNIDFRLPLDVGEIYGIACSQNYVALSHDDEMKVYVIK